MYITSLRDAIRLAARKKTIKQRFIYIIKGIVFLPFLVIDLKKTSRSKDDSASLSASGDDVYPLF